MAAYTVVSADSHVSEPGNLWLERMPAQFKDRAPRLVRKENGDWFECEGLRPSPVALGINAGKRFEEYKPTGMTYEDGRAGGWDPHARIKDQEIDGVEAEVLYPTLCMRMFSLEDVEFQKACFEAYNKWMVDYCRPYPQRLIGCALVPLDDIQWACTELERCAKAGLRGALIWGAAPEDRPYSDSAYDPFWARAQDLGIPLSLHIVTGARGSGLRANFSQMLSLYTLLAQPIQNTLCALVFGGVLDRFPKLRFVSAENDIGWLPHFLARMDHAWERYRHMVEANFKLLPSEYFRRQVYATFMDDKIGVENRKVIGTENIMWSSDYPHSDSTWPHSREVIAKDFAGVPEEDRRKILCENAVRLYQLG
jgi:predicted TIM-barrel fold metal-dependent hydrolase